MAVGRRTIPIVTVATKVTRPEADLVPPDCQWLTYEQAGRIIGVCGKTVYNYCRQGRLFCTKLGYKTVKIRRRDLDEFMAQRGPSPVLSAA